MSQSSSQSTASGNSPDALPDLARQGRELLVLSATILFLELAIIRWGGAQVRVLAYFPNLLLIGSFLGLGVGCLRAGTRSLATWWLPALLTLTVAYAALSRVVFTQDSGAEHLWLLYYDLPQNAPVVGNVWLPVLACFTLAMIAFISPGQMIAERLKTFQFQGKSLKGYAWDLSGSCAGTLLFSIVAFMRLKPLHWFGIALVGALWVCGAQPRKRRVVYALCGLAMLVTVHFAERARFYSPYYAISTDSTKAGITEILTNGSLHQVAINTDPRTAEHTDTAIGYHQPYRLSGHRPRHALVLGAGTGNDVATLLQEGAETVDVVEIDPVIIELGRALHPNRPYDSARVHIYNTDARAFLNNTTAYYDTIIFGTLDSMTRLSALSNVRLDNFVYTVNCLEAAKRRLTPDGGMALYFMTATRQIDLRIGLMLTKVFGEAPFVHRHHYVLFNEIFMAGPAFAKLDRQHRDALTALLTADNLETMGLPNDDWPYLYLNSRSLSPFYLIVMASIAVIAVVSVLAASRGFRRNFFKRGGFDGPMFFFGFGFLLLETRAVTAMNLVWGSTWLTSAVVFASILLMILAGTIGYARCPLGFRTSIAGLAVTLAVLYLLPNEWLLTMNVGWRLMLSVLVVGGPVLFAATGFAALYTARPEVSHAFGWNLLGAVAGGLAEFSSMVLGLRALLLLALCAYLAAYLLRRGELGSVKQPGAPTPSIS